MRGPRPSSNDNHCDQHSGSIVAQIFICCTAERKGHPFSHRDYERMHYYARLDQHHKHSLCDSPTTADIVAFIGSTLPNFQDITQTTLFKKYRHKAVIFYSGDRAIPLLPGIYTCLERTFCFGHQKSTRAGYYLRVTDNDSLDSIRPVDTADWLFSFMGNVKNHPIRKELLTITHGRAYIQDTSNLGTHQTDELKGNNMQQGLAYREVVERSKFILCPRGLGVSTWRLFETIRAGRVPVILSDAWVAPNGPDWSAFSLRVKERHARDVAKLLEEHEAEASIMDKRARQEWERWYAPENVFNTVADELIAAQAGKVHTEQLRRWLDFVQYLRPHFLRHWLISPMVRRWFKP